MDWDREGEGEGGGGDERWWHRMVGILHCILRQPKTLNKQWIHSHGIRSTISYEIFFILSFSMQSFGYDRVTEQFSMLKWQWFLSSGTIVVMCRRDHNLWFNKIPIFVWVLHEHTNDGAILPTLCKSVGRNAVFRSARQRIHSYVQNPMKMDSFSETIYLFIYFFLSTSTNNTVTVNCHAVILIVILRCVRFAASQTCCHRAAFINFIKKQQTKRKKKTLNSPCRITWTKRWWRAVSVCRKFAKKQKKKNSRKKSESFCHFVGIHWTGK